MEQRARRCVQPRSTARADALIPYRLALQSPRHEALRVVQSKVRRYPWFTSAIRKPAKGLERKGHGRAFSRPQSARRGVHSPAFSCYLPPSDAQTETKSLNVLR